MGVDDVSRAVLACVCESFETAQKPVCACYATIGTPVVATCCECAAGGTGSAILQVEQVYEVDQDLSPVTTRIVNCRRGSRAVDLTIWITRCYPTIDEHGELDNDAIDVAASDVHDDMDILYKAFACCYQGRLKIRRVAVDVDPEAGCSLIVGQVTVEAPL